MLSFINNKLAQTQMMKISKLDIELKNTLNIISHTLLKKEKKNMQDSHTCIKLEIRKH